MRRLKLALALAASLVAGTAVFAAVIGVTTFVNSTYPRTDISAGAGAISFDSVSKVLTIKMDDGVASASFATRWDPAAGALPIPHLTTPTTNGLSIYVKINDGAGLDYSGCATIPGSCLPDPGVAADFVMTGSYDINGNGNALDQYENGVLLRGSLTRFGFSNGAGTASDRLDFHFAPTSGLWLDNGWYQNKDIGVLTTLDTNDWPAIAVGQNSFAFDFHAGSHLNVLPVDCTGTIGDFVWDDSGNRNGLQDPGEPGINGVTVKLYQGSVATGAPFRTAVTVNSGNAPGFYRFPGLCQGTYTVAIDTPPAGFGSVTSNVGADRGIDSNDAHGSPVMLGTTPATFANQTIDFGFQSCMGAIGDFVWHDLNRNGVQDLPNEPGLAGVTVKLEDQNGGFIRSTATGGDGSYHFTGLCAGTYQIEVDLTSLPGAPGDFTPSPTNVGGNPAADSTPSPATVTLPTSLATDTSVDFGFLGKCEGTVGDFVWFDANRNGIQDADEAGIDGLTITLNPGNRTAVTGTNSGVTHGFYQFTGVCAGTYTISVSGPAGFAQTTSPVGTDAALDSNPQPAAVTLPWDNATDRTVDFGYTSCQGFIGDYVWQDLNLNGIQEANEPGFMGVVVNLRRLDNSIVQTATTDNIGGYLFTGVCPGDYKVEAAPPAGATPSPTGTGTGATDSNTNPSFVSLTLAHQSDDTIDFGFRGNGSIGDTVWVDYYPNGVLDAGEVGLSGVTVTLLDAANNTIQTRVTDVNGKYLFTGLAAGSYTVAWVKDAVTLNYDPTVQCTPGSTTVPGNVVCLADGSNDSNGIAGVAPTLASAAVTLPTNTSVNLTIDLGVQRNSTANLLSIGDRVWVDSNANGIQDAGEPGLANVKVTLSGPGLPINPAPFAITNASGAYHFPCNGCAPLQPGTFTVTIDPTTVPAGYVPTVQCTIGVGGCTAATNSSTGSATTVPALADNAVNAQDQTLDFGFKGSGSIGDRVWNDLNGNGIQDANETAGIAGSVVTLFQCAANGGNVGGTSTGLSITTPASGAYLFSNLAPGCYYVTFSTPSGYVPTAANVGSDATDSDAVSGVTGPFTLAVGASNLTVDAGFTAVLSLACPTATTGQTGSAFTSSFVSSGGVAPLTYSIASGALPPGLTINAATGAITGTPTTAGAFTFTGKVVDSLGKVAFSTCTTACGPAVTIAWDFSTPAGQLGTSQNYTANGVTVTANGFTLAGVATALYGTQDGDGDDDGFGVGIANSSLGSHEIDAQNFVQVDLQSLIAAGATAPQLKIGGVQASAGYSIYGSNTSGALGTALITNATLSDTFFAIPSYPTYRYVGVTASDMDVLLTALSATAPGGCTITISGESPCVSGTIVMSGNTATSGSSGNVKTFSLPGGVNAHVSAFSQNKSNSTFSTAYVGAYAQGLGVTDTSAPDEGVGSKDLHTVGNSTQNDYLLFEFDRKVVIDKISLGYIVTDSDMSVWIGNAPGGVNPFTTHQTLSASLLSGLGFTEVNTATVSSGARVADINATGVSGNILVVAAKIGDSDDKFKVNQLVIACLTAPMLTCAANAGTVNVAYGSAMVASGGVAPYTYSVTAGSLPPGLTLNKTTGAITGTPTTAGSYSYTAMVIDARGTLAGSTTSSCNITIGASTASVSILKKTNGTDNDALPGPTVAVGSAVTWTYVVTNTGTVALTSVAVSDDKAGAAICPASGLAPGATMTCSKSGTAVAGQYTNTGTVTAKSPTGAVVTASNVDHYFGVTSSVKLVQGDAAHIGYWNNANGQALIKSMNGSATAKNLATWLATNFPNLYGVNAGASNVTGKTNNDVAALYVTFFAIKQPRTEAQTMAAALAMYVTNSTLAGTTASAQGFNVSTTGTAVKIVNVKGDGAKVGLTNNTTYTVLALVQKANALAAWTPPVRRSLRNIFHIVNSTGDI